MSSDSRPSRAQQMRQASLVPDEPSLPYDPSFVPPASPGPDQVPVSRRGFVELCQRLTDLDEQAFEEAWRRLGLSVDWSTMYRTIDEASRAVSQRAFLRNLARGE